MIITERQKRGGGFAGYHFTMTREEASDLVAAIQRAVARQALYGLSGMIEVAIEDEEGKPCC